MLRESSDGDQGEQEIFVCGPVNCKCSDATVLFQQLNGKAIQSKR